MVNDLRNDFVNGVLSADFIHKINSFYEYVNLARDIQDIDKSVNYLSELLEDVASTLFKKYIKQKENINVSKSKIASLVKNVMRRK
jgi:dihydroneopterin aldolase